MSYKSTVKIITPEKTRLSKLLICALFFLVLLSGCKDDSEIIIIEDERPVTKEALVEKTEPIVNKQEKINKEVSTETDFSWRRYEGSKIGVFLVKHIYAERIIAEVADFERLTGIKVDIDVAPESAPESGMAYYAKLKDKFETKSSESDVIMTDIKDVWNFAPKGHLLALDEMMADQTMTDPKYDLDDIYKAILEASQWDLVYGNNSGTGAHKQWAIPIGFEQMALIYRADIFKKHNLVVPKTLQEIHDTAIKIKQLEPEMNAFVHRGYTFMDILSTLIKNYGARDVDKNLRPAFLGLNGLECHKDYIALLRGACPDNLMDYYWYMVVDDLAAGKAAMTLDADILGYMAENKVNSRVKGKLGYAAPPTKPGSKESAANISVWNISVSQYSDNPGAAWLFIQWATGKEQIFNAVANYTYMNPIRKSAWKNEIFLNKLKSHGNYRENFETNIPHSGYFFTPKKGSGKFIAAWKLAIRDMMAGADVEQRLGELGQELILNISVDEK